MAAVLILDLILLELPGVTHAPQVSVRSPWGCRNRGSEFKFSKNWGVADGDSTGRPLCLV